MDSKKEFLMNKEVNFKHLYCLEIVGGYRFAGNSYEIFDQFFGTTNPFVERSEFDGSNLKGSIFGDHFGG